MATTYPLTVNADELVPIAGPWDHPSRWRAGATFTGRMVLYLEERLNLEERGSSHS